MGHCGLVSAVLGIFFLSFFLFFWGGGNFWPFWKNFGSFKPSCINLAVLAIFLVPVGTFGPFFENFGFLSVKSWVLNWNFSSSVK